MVLLAILILIVKAPFLILRYLFTHRALLVGAVIIVAAIAVLGFFNRGSSSSPNGELPHIQQIAPSVQDAPFVVQSESRVYYVGYAEQAGSLYTAEVWWDYNVGKWEKHDTPLPFNKADIKIYYR